MRSAGERRREKQLKRQRRLEEAARARLDGFRARGGDQSASACQLSECEKARELTRSLVYGAAMQPEIAALARRAPEFRAPVILIQDGRDRAARTLYENASGAPWPPAHDTAAFIVEAEVAASLLRAVGSPRSADAVLGPTPAPGIWVAAVVKGNTTLAVAPF